MDAGSVGSNGAVRKRRRAEQTEGKGGPNGEAGGKGEVFGALVASFLAEYLRILQEVVVNNELFQTLIFSAYAADHVEIYKEPFMIWHRFRSSFRPLLPDFTPPRTPPGLYYARALKCHKPHSNEPLSKCAAQSYGVVDSLAYQCESRGRTLRDCPCREYHLTLAENAWLLRFRHMLTTGSAHPTTLTLALAALYRALDIPVRLCCAVPDPARSSNRHLHPPSKGPSDPSAAKRRLHVLSFRGRQDLLRLQWGERGVQLRPRNSHPPVIFLEVFWPETTAWIPVELYEGNFHFMPGSSRQAAHLKLPECRAAYLRKFASRILRRLQPQLFQPHRMIPLSDATSGPLHSGADAVASSAAHPPGSLLGLMQDWDDGESDDAEETEKGSNGSGGASSEECRRSPFAEQKEQNGATLTQSCLNGRDDPYMSGAFRSCGDKEGSSWLTGQILRAGLLFAESLSDGVASKLQPFHIPAPTSPSGPPASRSKGPMSWFQSKVCGVLALDERGLVKNVTRRYFIDYAYTERHRRFERVMLPIADASQAGKRALVRESRAATEVHLDDIDDLFLDLSSRSAALPSTISDFKTSPTYALKSQLRETQTLRPGAQASGTLFRGEPVYARKDVLDLLSARDWLKQGRQVRLGEKSTKVILRTRRLMQGQSQGQNQGQGQGGSTVREQVELFAETQTDELDDHRYQREGKFFALDKHATLPKGFVHIKESLNPGVIKAAHRLGREYKVAITGHEYTKGRLKPIADGVIVHAKDELDIVSKQRDIERHEMRKKDFEAFQRSRDAWRAILKRLAAVT